MEIYITPETGYKLTQIPVSALAVYALMAVQGDGVVLEDFPDGFDDWFGEDEILLLEENGLIESQVVIETVELSDGRLLEIPGWDEHAWNVLGLEPR